MAVRAGWLTLPADTVVVPDVEITIEVARRNPMWEAYLEDRERFDPSMWDRTPLPAPGIGVSQDALVAMALERAARQGEPHPELIMLARGSRFEVTRATGSGSVVFSDSPSWVVVTKGSFDEKPKLGPDGREFDPGLTVAPTGCLISVVDIETGQVSDSGGSRSLPDLSDLRDIVTIQSPH